MTGIPTALPPSVTPAQIPAPVVAVPVGEVPPAIASLPPNSVIDAAVAAALQQAQQAVQARAVVQLATALGDLTVRLPFPVPPNATLTLQLVAAGANPQLRVIAINGQPLQPAPPAGSAGPVETSIPDSIPTSSGWDGAATILGGRTVSPNSFLPPNLGEARAASPGQGIVVPPVGQGSGGIAATVVFGARNGLPTGTQLILRLLGIEPPGAAPESAGPETGTVFGGTAATEEPTFGAIVTGTVDEARGPAIAASAGAFETALAASADPGATPREDTPGVLRSVPGELESPHPAPGSAVPNAIAAQAAEDDAAPGQLTGTVAPNSLAGKPLIQTPIGLVALADAPDVAPGARVVFEIVGNPVPPQPAAPSSVAAAPAPSAAQPTPGWASFGEAVAVLQKADPPIAQMLMQRLPDLGPQFLVNAAGWVAAAESGDMRAWLGERAVKALEKAGRGDLVQRLAGDMAEMRAPAALAPGAGDWQVLTLPLLYEQRIERIRLTMRRRRDRDQDGHQEEGLRFLVDVEMSRLGAMQFDGLVKRGAKSFDLIVRSRRALPDEVRREIGAIFARALDGMGMVGGAVFKQAFAFVEPMAVGSGGTGVTI